MLHRLKWGEDMKIINIIVLNGEEIELKTLTEEKRREIANALNERALATLGYVRADKTA